MIDYLFGYPVYRSSINENDYEKDYIVSTIEKNYSLDPFRNEWDKNSIYYSNLHHPLDDERVGKYHEIDFSSLIPIYEEHTIKMLNDLSFKSGILFSLEIVNYTAAKDSQFMKSHIHRCDFSAVHYIKFNETHKPTLFINPAPYSKFIPFISPAMTNSLDNKNVNNSWIQSSWSYDTKEDDIIIFPGIADHLVPPSYSDDIRMTVVFNITILENND